HESLVTNHTVDAGSGRAGVRWYEIRDPNGSPSVFQQGTYAPADTVNRWMGSAAMDGAGDVVVGYSASGTTTTPSIRAAGRVPSDSAGSLEDEISVMAGTGSQTSSTN